MLEHGLAANTISERMTFARARWVEWGESWEVTGSDVAEWLSGFAGWTKVTYYNHFRSLFNWLLEVGEIDVDPMARMQRPSRPKGRPRPLTEAELASALAAASVEVRSFLMLGYLAGLRRFEIAKFRGEDITETGIYVMGKGAQAWTVPTHPLLWELAQQYPRTGCWFPSPYAEREGEPLAARTVGNKVSLLFRSLGIDGATHRCRHTYGTRLLRGGANLRVVQELLRHGSLETTALYLGVDEDEKVAAIRGLAA